MWYTYIIQCERGHLYTGITTDMVRRWREHTSGKRGARYFRTTRPARICRLESYSDRSEASRREAAIKKLSRAQKLALIAHQSPTPLPELPAE